MIKTVLKVYFITCDTFLGFFLLLQRFLNPWTLLYANDVLAVYWRMGNGDFTPKW